MPSKFIIRNFTEEGVYHLFNKSHPSSKLFKDEVDYNTFLYYLEIYTSPLDKLIDKHPSLPFRLRHNNIAPEIDILAYALLPDHYHLIVRIHTQDAASQLLKQIQNAYTYFFNRRHKHTGSIFHSRYKSVQLDIEKDLKNLVKYIHNEAAAYKQDSRYSSHHEYLTNSQLICKKRLLKSFFQSTNNYKQFTNQNKDLHDQKKHLKDIIIEK